MEMPFIAAMYEEGNEQVIFTMVTKASTKANIYSDDSKFGWKISAIYEEKNINAMATNLRNSMIIVALATLLIIFVALYFIISRTIKPLGQFNAFMDSVSQGDLTVQLRH